MIFHFFAPTTLLLNFQLFSLILLCLRKSCGVQAPTALPEHLKQLTNCERAGQQITIYYAW